MLELKIEAVAPSARILDRERDRTRAARLAFGMSVKERLIMLA